MKKKPNPFAKVLRQGKYRKQVVAPAKGKGSYERNRKHKEIDDAD